MKSFRVWFFLAIMSLLAGCYGTVSQIKDAPAIALVKGSQSDYQIVLPATTPNPGIDLYLKQVALCMQKSLQEGSGASLPIVTEDKMAADKPFISLGGTALARNIGLWPEQFQDYNGSIHTRNGNVYIIGHDAHGQGLEKRDHFSRYFLGSAKAAVMFMEDYLGVRFLLPGENGIAVKENADISLPGALKRDIKPSLIYASASSQDFLYSLANNGLGRGGFHIYGGHSYYDAVPEKTYASSNPEYFILRSGVRNPKGNHLCISNPEVQELIYAEMLRRLDAGAEVVELAQTDGYQACECDKCKAFGNTADEGEKLWILHNSLAHRLEKDRPGKKVMIISYGPTARPPKSISALPSNTMVELCYYSEENFAEWSKIKVPQGFTVYVYFWGTYKLTGFAPKRTAKYCKKLVTRFAENNVRGIYRCGFGENFGLEGPVYYVFGKLLDNPDADENLLLEEYYQMAFQDAAGPMRTFYQALYRQLEAFSLLEDNRVLPNPRTMIGYIFSADVLDTMGKNLARAKGVATTPKVSKRLQLIEAEFNYCRNLASITHLYNAYRLKPSPESFLTLSEAIDERNALIDSYYPNGKNLVLPDWPLVPFLGRQARSLMMSNGRLGATLGAPYTWNTKLLRENNILPGVGKKTTTVSKASAGNLSQTDFTSGAWSKANWEVLSGIQLGEIEEKSRFKVIRDQENLYVGIETDLPADRVINPVGHDGPCWGQDCLELVIDPRGAREEYFHFIFSPVKDSFYEAAFGLIKDPIDPGFNKSDPSWNGKWEYLSTRKDDKWYGFVKIPFASLGVSAPAAGTTWTFNVGRESFLGAKKGSGGPELSLWSPNLETMSFHDRDSFGELIFSE